jgi:uncharacterized membrane protein YbhN (UPF0104 family)
LAASCLTVLAEASLLAAAFGMAGAPIPWRGQLFASAADHVGGRLVPLPGDLGGVEGGMLGALALTGTQPPKRFARAAGYVRMSSDPMAS